MSGGKKCSNMNKLENIDEELENGAEWLPGSCHQPETPTESMEFLARSWSLSATQLSKALSNNNTNTNEAAKLANDDDEQPPLDFDGSIDNECSLLTQNKPLLTSQSPPMSPRISDETKESFLLHQALNPEFFSNQQQVLRNGQLYMRSMMMKRKSIGRWMKDEKEKKKQEIRAHNAQLHAAVSVAGVAAAVASLAASETSSSTALASAAALVASHCIEIAERMGADHEQILSVVNSAINARTNGDIMTLTAGAATALRGASTLRARLYTEHEALENVWNNKESSTISVASLDFVRKGGELLKRTRKGDLHWKQVSFSINSNWQVVAKMKSKHMGGTFTKKKKCVVSGIYSEIPAWPGRETEEGKGQLSYFAIQSNDRIFEFESRTKCDKQMWVQGIQHMLHLQLNMT